VAKSKITKKHWIPLIAAGVFGLAASWVLEQVTAAERLEHTDNPSWLRPLLATERLWSDAKLKYRTPEEARGVVVAKIDDASLEKFGRWPWSRALYAEILDLLYEQGASVVAFDAVFAEPEFRDDYLGAYLNTTIPGQSDSLKTRYSLTDDSIEGLKKDLPSMGDLIFADAVGRYPNTVLGYFWQSGAACQIYDPAKALPDQSAPLNRNEARQAGLLHVDTYLDNLSPLLNQALLVPGAPEPVAGLKTRLHLMQCPVTNRNAFNRSRFHGFFNGMPDPDGIFRRSAPLLGFESHNVPTAHRDFLEPGWFQKLPVFPSLALQAVRAHFGDIEITPKLKQNSDGQWIADSLELTRPGLDPVSIPLLPDGTLKLNFYGSQRARTPAFAEVSLANINGDLANPDFQKKYGLNSDKPLKDQIVLIGPVALGVYDLRPSPVQSDGPGVFLHATLAARLRQAMESKPQLIRYSSPVQTLLITLSGALLLGAAVIFSKSLGASFLALGFLCLILLADFYAFSEFWIWGPAMSIVVILLFLFLVLVVYRYFSEERDRSFVKGAFEKYVSPALVDQILEDPKTLGLGGEKREMSVLFSDIRGFTTFSERLEATALAQFLNEYLSPMTDVIQEARGTIDKYIGDAIMAIFGAPLKDPKHADAAVHAGLAMLKKLEELAPAWKARGLPEVQIGIGVNSGEMNVGNMGSSKIFSYTVIGDAVNLGSRLEGITKEYGVKFIISESTRLKLESSFVLRKLDRVRVKGKKLPVTIFEVVGVSVTPAHQARIQKFESALELYFTRDFNQAKLEFEQLANLDTTAKMFVERCAYWLSEAPESDWDGSWTMKTK
jgi:adenylate cyclase